MCTLLYYSLLYCDNVSPILAILNNLKSRAYNIHIPSSVYALEASQFPYLKSTRRIAVIIHKLKTTFLYTCTPPDHLQIILLILISNLKSLCMHNIAGTHFISRRVPTGVLNINHHNKFIHYFSFLRFVPLYAKIYS